MKEEPKYKEWFVWKHKNEILLFVCVIVAVFGVIKVAALMSSDENRIETTVAEETWITNCYRIVINDVDIGLVKTQEDGEMAIKQAMNKLIESLGYDPEANPTIRYYEEYSDTEIATDGTELVTSISQVIKEGIDVIKQKAYVMKIGDEFIIALESEEDVESVLQAAQNIYVSNDSDFDVQLTTSPYNGLVETPTIVPIQEELNSDRTFTASSGNNNSGVVDEEVSEEESEEDSENYGTTIAVEFTEEVIVTETYVDPATIQDVATAIEMITKENEEPKIYNVQAGDCPSIIAENNGMPLSQLYQLNPDLEDTKFIQIGDPITVMVPEPELSITTKEEVVYPTPIPRDTTYVENPNKYVGSNIVLDNGYNGVLEVTAIITKVNGNETERTIIKEEVISDPKDKVIEKGTKPLPSKGATGSYIPPLVNYTLTSGFGYRWGGFHYGIDMAAPTGTTIRAADGGVVTYSGWKGNYGYLVIIDHGNGVTTRYGHCNSLNVSVGQQVSQYQQIATVGSTGYSTGPHVHFEIRFDGVAANPLNYLEY